MEKLNGFFSLFEEVLILRSDGENVCALKLKEIIEININVAIFFILFFFCVDCKSSLIFDGMKFDSMLI